MNWMFLFGLLLVGLTFWTRLRCITDRRRQKKERFILRFCFVVSLWFLFLGFFDPWSQPISVHGKDLGFGQTFTLCALMAAVFAGTITVVVQTCSEFFHEHLGDWLYCLTHSKELSDELKRRHGQAKKASQAPEVDPADWWKKPRDRFDDWGPPENN